jgi:hypothetical protein
VGGRRRGVGADPGLRANLHTRRIGYVLAVAKTHPVTAGTGKRRAAELAAGLPARAWQRISAGPGAKGQRWYDWALVEVTEDVPGQHWLLLRRSPRTAELAFYRAYSATPVPLAALVAVAGRQWAVEEFLPDRQGVGRPGRAPGPRLDVLAPLDRAGHARPRLPVCHRRRRTRHPRTGRVDPVDLQRDPAPAHHRGHQARLGRRAPAALVPMATPTPSPRQGQPLPPPSRHTRMITIYGWSTSGASPPPDELVLVGSGR